ncbi:MAG: diacylglycerol kinase family protein [Candidatus Acidiferrales bacterium]
MVAPIRKAVLIYNPVSGRRRSRRLVEIETAGKILSDAGIAIEFAPTFDPGSGTTIARQAVAQKFDLVIACGGDGTVNEIVNGLAGSRVPMALLPAGTANILAKELGIPWNIPAAARLIPSSTPRRIALGSIAAPGEQTNGNSPHADRYFLCVGGSGPDGAIVNGVDSKLKKSIGQFAYWAEGMRQLFTYKFPLMRVESRERTVDATIVVVGRTAEYGGPFRITDGASLYENCFEIVAFSTRSRLRYLFALPALYFGKLRGVRGISAWKTADVTCTPLPGGTLYAQLDGEPVGALPLRFRIVPDALTLMVPSSAAKASDAAQAPKQTE